MWSKHFNLYLTAVNFFILCWWWTPWFCIKVLLAIWCFTSCFSGTLTCFKSSDVSLPTSTDIKIYFTETQGPSKDFLSDSVHLNGFVSSSFLLLLSFLPTEIRWVKSLCSRLCWSPMRYCHPSNLMKGRRLFKWYKAHLWTRGKRRAQSHSRSCTNYYVQVVCLGKHCKVDSFCWFFKKYWASFLSKAFCFVCAQARAGC